MRSTARWSGVVLWWCSAWSRAIDRMVSSICAGRSGGGTFVSAMAYPQLGETEDGARMPSKLDLFPALGTNLGGSNVRPGDMTVGFLRVL